MHLYCTVSEILGLPVICEFRAMTDSDFKQSNLDTIIETNSSSLLSLLVHRIYIVLFSFITPKQQSHSEFQELK